MGTTTGALGTIYIGDAIEPRSERRIIAHVHRQLEEAGLPFIILANFHILGRQTDIIVVTERRVVVIEAKSSRLPVRGNIDGGWQRLEASGVWAPYTNGYRQALTIKNSLRDAMSARKSVGGFYPDAMVVFADPLPEGSALSTGDIKVDVTDLDGLDAAASGRLQCAWTIADWRAFADDFGLARASLAEVISEPRLAAAHSYLREYAERVANELGRNGGMWFAEDDGQRAALVAAAGRAPGCRITGPSGCGKTLALCWLGSELARAGECVIFASAKDYAGSWSELLKRELALITATSPKELFGAIQRTGSPVTLILDGVNELGSRRESGLRGLRALARRLDARIMVSDQSAQLDQLDGLIGITLAAPSLSLKERIARRHSPRLSDSSLALLSAVHSGFEASIVAETDAGLVGDTSRQLLVDQYIRSRLGAAARSGAAGLRRLAERLISSTSFSLNETIFDELMTGVGISTADVDAAVKAKLLSRRNGRVSFSHEILLNACAAFSYAERARTAPSGFAALLEFPSLAPMALGIVSMVDEESAVRTLLEETEDAGLLFGAARGMAGSIAASVANELLDRAQTEIEEEIFGLRLVIARGETPDLVWDEATVRRWSDRDAARIEAIARLIGTGRRDERFFELCAVMDRRLAEERRRIADEAREAGIRALVSAPFQLAYQSVWQGCGFARLCQSALSGIHLFDTAPAPILKREMMSMSSGQLYFYLERRRRLPRDDDANSFALELVTVITERFRYEPYHAKLTILEAAGFVRDVEAATVEALTDAVQAIDANRENLWISTAIVDALKFLGALEDSAEAARDGIRAAFAEASAESDDETVRGLALTVSTAMFDHPHDYVYYEEYEALTEEARRLLLRQAARSDDARKSSNLGWLIREISKFADPADEALMQEYARLPEERNAMPQEEWAAFTVATRFLGRNRLRLPALTGTNDSQRALILLRSLLYALEGSADILPPDTSWLGLRKLPDGVVVGCLSELERALREHQWYDDRTEPQASLLKAYPQQCLALAREFFDGDPVASYYRYAHSRDDGSNLAFSIIESWGDRSDLARLRRLADMPRFVARALKALRRLDTV
ncbi:MAG: NERD domain-containing protein [Pseudomonadota bacterium]